VQRAQTGDVKFARGSLIWFIFFSAIYRRLSVRYFLTSLLKLYFPRLIPHLVAFKSAVYESSLFELKRVVRNALKKGANQNN
jgi:hypothetical protein